MKLNMRTLRVVLYFLCAFLFVANLFAHLAILESLEFGYEIPNSVHIARVTTFALAWVLALALTYVYWFNLHIQLSGLNKGSQQLIKLIAFIILPVTITYFTFFETAVFGDFVFPKGKDGIWGSKKSIILSLFYVSTLCLLYGFGMVVYSRGDDIGSLFLLSFLIVIAIGGRHGNKKDPIEEPIQHKEG